MQWAAVGKELPTKTFLFMNFMDKPGVAIANDSGREETRPKTISLHVCEMMERDIAWLILNF